MPAFIRVEPVITSGPVGVTMLICATWVIGVRGFDVSPIVTAPFRLREFERAQDIGCPAAGRDSDDGVLGVQAARGQVLRPLRAIVFRAFDGVRERAAASRDHGLDHARRRAKRRRKFRGVERREAPAGSRANIEEAAALLQGARNGVHGARNRGKRGLNGACATDASSR